MSTYEFDGHPAGYNPTWMRALVQRVIDGDTAYYRIDMGFHAAITIPGRLKGVNCPELNTVEGKTARDMVKALIEGQPVLVRTYKDTQSFARWIVEVQYAVPMLSPTGLSPGVSGVTWNDLAAWIIGQGYGVAI